MTISSDLLKDIKSFKCLEFFVLKNGLLDEDVKHTFKIK